MRVLLIRHGETVHNVAGVYAGVTDSALTNHGFLQANRLGVHLAVTGVKISHIFSSDLQRAFKTAEAVRLAQLQPPVETVPLEALREQDFGFYEGKQFFERPRERNKSGKEEHQDAHRNDPGFKDVESKDSMRIRSDAFIDDHLIQLLHAVPDYNTVVVVAHGIILSHLWRALLKRFSPGRVSVSQGIETLGNGFSLEHLGGWSNTGYLDLEIKIEKDLVSSEEMPVGASAKIGIADIVVAEDLTTVKLPQKPRPPPPIVLSKSRLSQSLNMSLVVRAVNSKQHLVNLKKTRGGIGSLEHDSKQKTVDSFFKKRRLE
ncbi:hypothetical protein PZA11_005669 [Diplocarpon coronariae]